MYIVELHLVGFKRLGLSGIKEFTLTPAAALQLILGTNGSGKSSLLSELTPLPATPADYHSGGMKRITILHNGCTYVLTSEISRVTKHSFLKDDVELNPGGTSTVQRELVEKEFNFTPQIVELLTGRVTFTDMSPSKRREWITLLNDRDLTYANDLYKRIKTCARDIQGASKVAKERLARETLKLQSLDVDSDIGQRVEKLSNELSALMSIRDPNARRTDEVQREIQQKSDELIEYATRMLKAKIPSNPIGTATSKDELVDALAKLHNQQSVNSALYDKHVKDLHELEDVLNGLMETGADGVERLEEKIVELENSIGQTSTNVVVYTGNVRAAILDAQQVSDSLQTLVEQIDTSYTPMDQERRTAHHRESTELSERLSRYKNELSRRQDRVAHMLAGKTNNCPKCGYVWNPLISEEELCKLKNSLPQLSEEIERMEQRKKVVDELSATDEQYLANLRRFRLVAGNVSSIKGYWDQVIEADYFHTAPRMLLAVLANYINDLEVEAQRLDQQAELDHYRQTLDRYRVINGSTGGGLSAKSAKLTKEVENLAVAIDVVKAEIADVQRFEKMASGVLKVSERVAALEKELDGLYLELIDTVKQETVRESIHSRQSAMAGLQSRLNERNAIEAVIADLSKSLDEMDVDTLAWEALADVLSPNDGIIAEQMTGFIGAVVGQMNRIIERVWGYGLEVIPCGIESGDLNYKFPLRINNDLKPSADIKESSTGQRDIVNFAFMLTAMIYLQLEDYPIYVDELGASFDEHHRTRVMDFIKELIQAGQCKQLFMVNHYSVAYGGFSNAEYCVLDAANITVPSSYNEHVVIV